MSGKVIDLSQKFLERRQKHEQSLAQGVSDQTENSGTPAVVQLDLLRQKEIDKERRVIKRTILTEFVGTHAVIPGAGLQKVALYDVSESGLSFDTGAQYGHFQEGETVVLRLYLSSRTYLPIPVLVQNIRAVEGEPLFRHGGAFQADDMNFEAIRHFVKFIESVSVTLKKDNGETVVSGLTPS